MFTQRRNLFLADSMTTPNPSATKTKKRRRKAIPETRAEDSDGGGGGDKRSSGLAREPGMPKRPHNAFFYYSQDKRPRYKRGCGLDIFAWNNRNVGENVTFLKWRDNNVTQHQILRRILCLSDIPQKQIMETKKSVNEVFLVAENKFDIRNSLFWKTIKIKESDVNEFSFLRKQLIISFFGFFFRMQKDFPNLSKKEIAGILSARWSQIPTEEKLVKNIL